MDGSNDEAARPRHVALPTRGGGMAVLEMGPADRPVDIVFSHANGFNGRTYRTILAPLARDHRVLAVDMRGHGASTLPTPMDPARGGWNVQRDDLLALLDDVAEGPVVLAGHSMGATVSLLAAAAAPDKVRALALFDPVIFGAAESRQSGLGEALATGAERRRPTFPTRDDAMAAYTGRGAFRTWRPEQLADYVAAGFVDTPEGEVALACAPAWEAFNYRVHNYDAWDALDRTRCPVRIICAEIASPAQAAERLDDFNARPNVRCEIVPGTTHFLPMERPDLVQATLRALTPRAP